MQKAAMKQCDFVKSPRIGSNPLHGLFPRRKYTTKPTSPLHLQRRWFFSFGRDINKLEEVANAKPDDASRQAALYRALIDNEPEVVIRRFEDRSFARDQECANLYLAALYETNQLDRATHCLLDKSITNNNS